MWRTSKPDLLNVANGRKVLRKVQRQVEVQKFGQEEYNNTLVTTAHQSGIKSSKK